MSAVDQRVVEMRFDNKHFEKNVSTTLTSLEKLKSGLRLNGASRGLDQVSNSMSSAKDTLKQFEYGSYQAGFAWSDVLAKISSVAEWRMARAAVDTMINGVKELSTMLLGIKGLKAGFSEYETQMNSVQTILANTESKGSTIDDVNAALDELNTYADKTIYNFTEMTRNIGTFTAAGVDLETSTNAIQGIANLAAVSGSTSQQASTAMYQLSQALASGTVRLMDWNSVVNAGMGGEVFQNALKETARAHGIAIDEMIEAHGSFRETLSEDWLSADILTETLENFTMATEGLTEAQIAENRTILRCRGYTEDQIDAIFKLGNMATNAATKVKTFSQLWSVLEESAQSGWAKTWEILVGDFDEAKDTLTKLSDLLTGMVNASSKARNELLQGWKDAGGRADVVDSMFNAIEGIRSVIIPIKEAFSAIFPPITVDRLTAFTKGLKEFTAKLKIGDETSDKLKRTFKGLFATLDIAWQIIKGITKGIGSLAGTAGELGGGILNATATFGDWLVKVDEAVKKGQVFEKIFKGLSVVIKGTLIVLKTVGGWITNGLVKPLLGISNAASDASGELSDSFESMSNKIKNSGFVKFLTALWGAISRIMSAIAESVGSMASGLADWIGNLNFDKATSALSSLSVTFGSISIAGILAFFAKFTKGFSDVADSVGSFKDSALDILNSVKGCFEAYQQDLKANVLLKIAAAIAILVAAILVLSLIEPNKLGSAISAITMLFVELIAATALFGRISSSFGKVGRACMSMIIMSTSILILASALKKLEGMSMQSITNGLIAISVLSLELVAISKLLSKNKRNLFTGVTSLITFSTAVLILAEAVKKLGELDAGEMTRGLIAITVLLAELTIVLKTMPKFVNPALGFTLLGVATALLVLSGVLHILGRLSWMEIAKGLTALTGSLIALGIGMKILPKLVSVKLVYTLLALAASMAILAGVLHIMGNMTWDQIGKGLTAMSVSLLALTVAMKLMPKRLSANLTFSLLALAGVMAVLTGALYVIGGMSWDTITKGLVGIGGSLIIFATAMKKMKTAILGAAALLMIAAAFAILTPVLVTIGSMSWGSLVKGLVALAGVFIIFGVAATALQAAIPAMMLIAAAVALLGVGCMAAGAGVLLFATGLTALAASGAAVSEALVVILANIITLIPELARQLAVGIKTFAESLVDAIPAIANVVSVLIVELCGVLVECVPVLADALLQVVVALLNALVEYTPQIVDGLFNFIIAVIDGLARNTPPLIKSVVNLLMSIFQGAIDALSSVEFDTLVKGLAAVGLIGGLMIVLATLAGLAPAAMLGVLAFGAILAELGIVLSAIGALAQIPGLEWLINEGGKLLESIGNAVGKLIGGIVGGFAEGVSSSFPQIASDLSQFMQNLQPFIDGAKSIDSSVVEGVKSIVDVVLAITGASLLEGITSFITGKSSIASFSEELPLLGAGLKAFSDSVTGISVENIYAASDAAKALAEMTSHIPNEGGVVGWWSGENSIAKFGEELPKLGEGLKGFSDAVTGISVENIYAASDAAKALAEMASHIPNEGGVTSWFAGDNSISKFGTDLILLGVGLKGFSDEITGVKPENIISAADAAKALAEMASRVPNEGGVTSWFAGDNSISKFGTDLISLGAGLKGFSDEIAGVVPENIIAAADAAKALAEMTSCIPNEGGVVSWFAGDNSISKFGEELPLLGAGLKGFSDEIAGIVPENISAAAAAAKDVAEMASHIPKEGGVVAWFVGENSISKFGDELPKLGAGLKGFSDAVAGIVPANITAASEAAKELTAMTKTIPKEGGVVAWFTGEASISKFGDELPKLGAGLKGFSDAIDGIVPANITAAAGAAEDLANMTKSIPTQNGVVAWFTGEQSISKFGDELPKLGAGLKGFSTSIEGINADNIKAAANAAKALAEMANVVPKQGGIQAWFTGDNSMSKFADKLPDLGKGLKGFSDSVSGINPDSTTAAASAAKDLADMTNVVPADSSKIVSFGTNLFSFGSSLRTYFGSVGGITAESIETATKAVEAIKDTPSLDATGMQNASKAIESLANTIKGLSGINVKSTSGFVAAIKEIGKVSVTSFIEEFEALNSEMTNTADKLVDSFVKTVGDSGDEFTNSGKTATESFAKGVDDNVKTATSSFDNLASGVLAAIIKYNVNFTSAGSNLVAGFAAGITANTFAAVAAARAMAAAAIAAAKEALDINSPSKVGYDIGDFFGLGFVNAIGDYADRSYNASAVMANSAKSGLSDAISKVRDVIDSDMDMQPTIRPVLDLSDVRANAGAIGSILGDGPSVGVMANVGAISSMMNNRIQNGGNSDVVDSINALRKELGNVGNTTYSINGITYDDGSNVSEAVKSLVRAARVERRM